jgi:hypothetical protein
MFALKSFFSNSYYAPASERLIHVLLALLTALGPPCGPRPKGNGTPPSTPASVNVAAAEAMYVGYRRDLVAVLASACHRRQHIVGNILTSGTLSRRAAGLF